MKKDSAKKAEIPLNLYKKIHELMPIVCVDVILVNAKKEFLLVKRKNRPAKELWWFPGGRILRNELIFDAAKRKAQEETGLKVRQLKVLGTDETIFPDGPFGKSTHTVNIVLLAKIRASKPKITIDPQSEGYGWFSRIDKKWHSYIKKFLTVGRFK